MSTTASRNSKLIETTVTARTNVTAVTGVFNFNAVKHLLSSKPLRHPKVEEDVADLISIESAKQEGVYFSYDEVARELGLN